MDCPPLVFSDFATRRRIHGGNQRTREVAYVRAVCHSTRCTAPDKGRDCWCKTTGGWCGLESNRSCPPAWAPRSCDTRPLIATKGKSGDEPLSRLPERAVHWRL